MDRQSGLCESCGKLAIAALYRSLNINNIFLLSLVTERIRFINDESLQRWSPIVIILWNWDHCPRPKTTFGAIILKPYIRLYIPKDRGSINSWSIYVRLIDASWILVGLTKHFVNLIFLYEIFSLTNYSVLFEMKISVPLQLCNCVNLSINLLIMKADVVQGSPHLSV